MTEPRDQLAELVRAHGGRTVARKLGVDEKTLRNAVLGKTQPRPSLQAALLRTYGIAWSSAVRPGQTAPEPPSVRSVGVSDLTGARLPDPGARASPPAQSAPLDALATVRELLDELRKERERMKADPAATSRDRAAIATALTSATRLLAKVTGTSITTSAILKSPQWVSLMRTMVEALRPYPGALDHVAEALEAAEANE